ncbi:hypothetical protein L3Q82_013134, partial [Scortum barcoo]
MPIQRLLCGERGRRYIGVICSGLSPLAQLTMGYSTKCPDLKKRWVESLSRCVPCRVMPGHEITPNCGYGDDGSRHEAPMRNCSKGTFNDGSAFYCAPCKLCLHGAVRPCNATADTECEELRINICLSCIIEKQSARCDPCCFSSPPSPQSQDQLASRHGPSDIPPRARYLRQGTDGTDGTDGAAPVAVFICVTVILLSVYVVYMKWKRGQNTVLNYNRKTSFIKAGFSPLSAHPGHNDLQDILGPNILSAPLQSVLDNLDVLEELIILLDPENHGVKGTKHLASHCNFSSTWVTYTYSMKDTKSPLKAVLEGVTSRHPDLTISHLAKLLKQMERNDAIAVLAKLSLNERE